jgi:hypothetical protein
VKPDVEGDLGKGGPCVFAIGIVEAVFIYPRHDVYSIVAKAVLWLQRVIPREICIEGASSSVSLKLGDIP